MTDIATALAAPVLAPVEGRDVLRSTIQITKAGDGLSDALAIEPREFHHGDRVFVVLECEMTNLHFPRIKDTEALIRQHTLTVVNSTIVEEHLVRTVLDEQAEAIRLAREAAAGITRIPWDGTEDEAIAAAHAAGEHVDLVDGCLDCDAERAATTAGD